MSHIEDEYRNRFQDQELTNTGIDQDSLWDEIAPAVKIPPKKIKGKSILPFSILIGLFLFAGMIYQLNTTDLQTNLLDEEKIAAQESISEKIDQKTNMSIKKTNSESEIRTNNRSYEQSNTSPENISGITTEEKAFEPTQKVNNKEVEKNGKKDFVSKEFTTIGKNKNTLDAQDPSSSIITSSDNIFSSEKLTNTELFDPEYSSNVQQAQNSDNSLNSKNLTKTEAEKVQSKGFESASSPELNISANQAKKSTEDSKLSRINLPFYISQKNEQYTSNLQSLKTAVTSKEDQTKEKYSQWKLSVFGGINHTDFKFKSNSLSELENLKNETELAQLGWNTGFNTSLILNKKLLLNSGLEYHQLNSKFDYQGSREVEMTKENHLARVLIDAFTNDTLLQVYQDTSYTLTEDRLVLHYNRYSQLRVPLEIGFQHEVNKLTLGISAGLVFNFTLNQSGKTLNKDLEVSLFDKNSTLSPFRKFDIGYRLSPFIGYQVSKRWSLSLHPQLNYLIQPSFDQANIKMTSNQFSFNIGLDYQIN